MPDLPQPASYNRFDPLDEQSDESRLPSVGEPAANDNVVAPNAVAPNAVAPNAVAPANSGAVANVAATEAESFFDSEKLTASEAEERRAGQLLDRAFSLWERGDTAGAILACRQSLTLSPASAPAYSMLGLLLERTGDTNGAIAAYEKAVEIEPSSLLERDSARRLRASMGQALPTRFHFQEAELFDAIDGEPAEDHATNFSDDIAPNTPREPSATTSVAPSSTRLNAETSSVVATNTSSTAAALPVAAVPSTTSLLSTPTAPTKVATTSPSMTSPSISTSDVAAATVASGTAVARVPDAATQVTPTQMAPSQIEAPVRARPMRATLPASAPQVASAPQATAPSTTISAGASALENPARPATIAAPIKPASSAIATSVAAPSAVVAPIATPPVVHTGEALAASSGASSRLDTMVGSRSTFWTRSLPLMAAAGTGFLFLLWSRDIALERERRAVSTTNTTIINNTPAPGAPLNNLSNTANGTQNGVVVTNGVVTNGAASTSAPGVAESSNAATSKAATSNAASAAPGGTTTESSTQSGVLTPSVEPQIAPSGLVVSNAPAPVRRAASDAERNTSQRESAPRVSRRSESVRTRRTFRAENQERPARRSRYADADVAANGGSSVLRQPDVRLIPPAGVPQLPRAQEPSSSAASNSVGNALPPAAPSGSIEEGAGNGNGGLRPYAGPLPSFPSPSQVQSRAQNEIRPRPSSSASNRSATNISARDGESAYQYQTRALTYVEQGDNARAADDFQSAMALYRRQIARGENVGEARRGLEACQKGLRLISAS